MRAQANATGGARAVGRRTPRDAAAFACGPPMPAPRPRLPGPPAAETTNCKHAIRIHMKSRTNSIWIQQEFYHNCKRNPIELYFKYHYHSNRIVFQFHANAIRIPFGYFQSDTVDIRWEFHLKSVAMSRESYYNSTISLDCLCNCLGIRIYNPMFDSYRDSI